MAKKKHKIEDSIFELYDEEGKEERLANLKEEGKKPSKAQEVGRGAAQGAGDILSMYGFLEDVINLPSTLMGKAVGSKPSEIADQPTPQQEFIEGKKSPFEYIMGSMEDVSGPPILSPEQKWMATQPFEDIPEGGHLQEGTRRATRSLPWWLLGGPAAGVGVTAREGAGMGGKEIAKRMGFDETGQTVFDLLFSIAPNPTKLIPGTGRLMKMAATGQATTQQELLDAARRMKWSEEEIAPLVREGWFSNLLAKISPSVRATEKALEKSNVARQRGFEILRGTEEAAKTITSKGRTTFIKNAEEAMKHMPAGAKERIAVDYKDLLKSNMSGSDFMDFWHKTNSYFAEHPSLQGFKDPMRKAIQGFSPELSRDFEMQNTLSQRYREAMKKLSPSIASQVFHSTALVGEAGTFLYGLYTGDLAMVAKAAGLAGVGPLAELMTVNPRFINLHQKLIRATTGGHIKAVKKVFNDLVSMIGGTSPEVAAKLREITPDELEQILSSQED